MQVSASTNQEALGPGADLWILPESQLSHWTQQIDWHLNFQISRAQLHQSQNLSPVAKEILFKCALENLDWVEEHSERLLILSSQNLPNRWVLVLNGANQIDEWLKEATAVWKSLAFPTLRFFLPETIGKAAFEKKWLKASHGMKETSVSFVEDLNG
jgi:hypothetical protein